MAPGGGKGGKGLGKNGGKCVVQKRHRRILRDNIMGITKPDIRRLARRGGVKRISAGIYGEVRGAMRDFLQGVLHDCCAFLEHANRKTVVVKDVIYALKRRGRPIYGFDPDFIKEK
ncbi:histone-fold-containing protein [Saitoella complicata NRRL Y-17804]|nr:histone-fold-containing protein [Saitoella complicata NRRL Y-17804]ODQ54965.1 histone-fold-containing protein [Saitoella complicata NRRL Y-17804]